MKVSPAFSKAVESRGKASGRAPQSAELSFCSNEIRKGVQGGNPIKGFPPSIFSLGTCAPIRWAVVVSLPCRSTPFLWCLPKETVSSRQRKALFLPRWLHHSRERYKSVDYTFLARLGAGAGVGLGLSTCAPFPWAVVVTLSCDSTPFLWCLPKETVSSRQRKAL